MPATKAHPKIRVFLVDDHPIVRKGFQLLFGMEPDLSVCGEAENASVALEKILAAKPDVAIVDLTLQNSSGLDLIRELRERMPNLRILVFTMWGEATYAERALRAGANGYITKEEGTEKAVEAMRALMKGKRYLSQRLTETIIERISGSHPAFARPVKLSDREQQVLELLGNGFGSREIATALQVSMKTVESHRENIKAKVGLRTAAQLVSYAFNWVRRERP